MQNETITEDTTWSGRYDVVVIGSGCGGGVVAAELAAEGHRVLVVDKGPYQPRAAYTQVEADAFDTMYEQGGVCVTQDTGIAVLAGSCFGGGSAINWACSLRTPNFVREEWANTFGLRSFIERSYEESLEAICKRINVSDYDEADTVNHNTCNQIFIDGCRNLGYDVAVAPQNMADVTTKADQANAGRVRAWGAFVWVGGEGGGTMISGVERVAGGVGEGAAPLLIFPKKRPCHAYYAY